MKLILGIESSCDETGIALYHTERGLLAHALHSQVKMHNEYGGVVPELASRDHVHRVLPLIRSTMRDAGCAMSELDVIAYTQGPGLSGALLVGASVGCSLAYALNIRAIGIHHLEGHLLSPLLSEPELKFPFIALLVSGGHTQLMRVDEVGVYTLLGETLDDAAGEAFDKSAKLLGLDYPGGPALAKLAQHGQVGRFNLPRPMLHSGNLDFSFSGLKTAVLTLVKQHTTAESRIDDQTCADIALATQQAIVDVLVSKALSALKQTALKKTGLKQLVVAGGVGANQHLRQQLNAAAAEKKFRVFYPALEFCTDNGAMIAYAAALRLRLPTHSGQEAKFDYQFNVKPRWDLQQI